jgi:hypothetical protein
MSIKSFLHGNTPTFYISDNPILTFNNIAANILKHMNFKFQFTMLVIAVLSSSIALVSTPAFAQTTGTTGTTGTAGSANNDSDFNEFLTCMFDGNANGSVSETEIRAALGSGSTTDEPTESEIRDCFTPIYNTGSAADDEESDTTGSAADDEESDTTGSADEEEEEEESDTTGNDGITPQG